jgi:hypothetical protein
MYVQSWCEKEMYAPNTSKPGMLVQPSGVQYSPLVKPVSNVAHVPLLSDTSTQLVSESCTNIVKVLGSEASCRIWPR